MKALLLGIGLALGLASCPLVAAPVLEPARSLLEQPYGEHPAQRFDVYLPARAERAPILLIVHGGGWAQGDKAARGMMRNKLKRWLPRGLILVSSNYRLLDQGGDPRSQAEDLARALAEVQRQATAWGGDPQRVVLIGHSAGAHLVSLLASDPRLAAAAGARPWLGTIALDSAAFDVETIMRGSPLRLYQRAFGSDPAYWRAVSPLHQLTAAPAPLLAVCSSRRADACRQAQAFQRKAQQLGGRVERLEVDLSHGQIDRRLGLPGGYTEAVERFLGSLDGELAQRLSR